ncbi:hypothetical protein GCM10007140_31580 [Priestia taiwanensis]|uniref:Uncharacterized protein n=1 Tax=Priestia taiwanensis TaxID=1347902 RepID=A0A917ETM1_9BACI|nr:hypothetical protein GCM10007140_31580 [Priestia taiwanensis]
MVESEEKALPYEFKLYYKEKTLKQQKRTNFPIENSFFSLENQKKHKKQRTPRLAVSSNLIVMLIPLHAQHDLNIRLLYIHFFQIDVVRITLPR